jgi:hypothetical protein
MNLKQVRQKFVELSGHHELVVDTEDWADNGADFYIRAGQEFLDRRAGFNKQRGKVFRLLEAGEWTVLFPRCRVIEDVLINTSEARIKLAKADLIRLYQEFPGPIATTDRGTPIWYSPAITRGMDVSGLGELGDFFNFVQADEPEYRGIVILPPPSEPIVVTIIGQFYSAALEGDPEDPESTADTAESFWTVQHSDMLILASLYQLETLYHRNTQGANDYMNQLIPLIEDLDKDLVEETIRDIRQLEG